MMEEEWSDWIEHDGGACPCVGKMVQMELREGFRWEDGRRISRPTIAVDGDAWSLAVVSYRIRTPRSLQFLREMIADELESV